MLDTEQTGTNPNSLCQLAYIESDGGELRGVNRFFAVDAMNEYAQKVHGLSIASLVRLSGGGRFAQYAVELAGALAGKRLAGHAVASDIRCLKAEFGRCGLSFKPEQFCTMKHFAMIMNLPGQGRRPKSPNLDELRSYMGVSHEDAADLAHRLFGIEASRHDARYDACATYLCIRKAAGMGLVRGLSA